MSTGGVMVDTCSVYGCPLLGSFGESGKWVCACHFRAAAARHNAITAVLNQHSGLAERAVFLRRSFAPAADILSAEAELIELTRETGTQTQIPTAGVTGPRSAAPYFAEVDE
ncbi:hypothetical protein [Burkholderia glumae]|uniref:hypothetical protein n=1 Tax=Burkholderia glumae TaxID=337 RepID=UPI0021645150|nr:hypothetical protein [Burkholderia glumae]UVS95668.1 hypothetical protein EFP19_07720 [Burkholderia glumae]